MTDKPQRINTVNLETRCFNIGELRFTPNGNAVCNARFNIATKHEDEWQTVWYQLTADRKSVV